MNNNELGCDADRIILFNVSKLSFVFLLNEFLDT